MKSLKLAGLCLASMLVMGMALAGNAAAAPLWLVCLEGTNLTKYEDDQCSKLHTGGIWQSQGIPTGKSVTVTLTAFSLRLRDPKATGGPSAVKCNGTGSEGWGLIEPSNIGKVFKAKINNPRTNCERLEGACKAGEVESVEGVNLPWSTRLTEESEKFLIQIQKGTGGNPGWAVTCNTLLGLQTDTCTAPSEAADEHLRAENLVSGGVLLIKGEFAKRSRAKCTQAKNEEVGEISGWISTLLANGFALSINKA